MILGDGPLKDNFKADLTGVVKQEFITYKKENGMLVKHTTTRNYFGDSDYNDSHSSEPLAEVK